MLKCQIVYTSSASVAIDAHFLFQWDAHNAMFQLIDHYWGKDLTAELDVADLATDDEHEMQLLSLAQSLGILQLQATSNDQAAAWYIKLTSEGLEAYEQWRITINNVK